MVVWVESRKMQLGTWEGGKKKVISGINVADVRKPRSNHYLTIK